MGKDADDHTTTLSSIALLQERFRQLQRMKELRQQRELKRSQECRPRSAAFLSGARPTPTPTTTTSHCQLALSLWPEPKPKRAESYPSSPAQLVCTSPHFNLQSSDTEIDTSLRL